MTAPTDARAFLRALFGHLAPLALNASVVFEQEYSGVEGDSVARGGRRTLLSTITGLPLAQGIAVTGALNQHGEVLPVGGINEKIEGWFRACETAGLMPDASPVSSAMPSLTCPMV